MNVVGTVYVLPYFEGYMIYTPYGRKNRGRFFFWSQSLAKWPHSRWGSYDIIEFLLLLIGEKNSGVACTSCYNR